MIRIVHISARLSLAAGLAFAVSACGKSNSTPTATTTPVVATAPQEAQFGSVFATDYRAAANSEPANVSDTDITPISPMAEPANVN